MNINEFTRISKTCWRIEPEGKMRVPALIHASESLLCDMDDKVREQLVNVATLPGIVEAAWAMKRRRVVTRAVYRFPESGGAAALQLRRPWRARGRPRAAVGRPGRSSSLARR